MLSVLRCYNRADRINTIVSILAPKACIIQVASGEHRLNHEICEQRQLATTFRDIGNLKVDVVTILVKDRILAYEEHPLKSNFWWPCGTI